jgi:hypothetical protein
MSRMTTRGAHMWGNRHVGHTRPRNAGMGVGMDAPPTATTP